MNKTVIPMMLTVIFIAVVCAEPQERLKIYLPREITIEGSDPNLGQVAIIRGEGPLAAAAASVTLGQISSPHQSLVISRTLVLSRLACSGIPAYKVSLIGAQETRVTRQHQRITASQLAEAATAFLKAHLPDPSICQVEIIRSANDLILPGQADKVTLKCRQVAHGSRNQCKVQVTVLQDGNEIAAQDITFQFRYQCRKAMTTTAIPKGTPMTADNVTIKTEISNYPEPAGWTPPYGLIAHRDLAAHTIVTENIAKPPVPEVLLKRNQGVLIRIDRPGLTATANGKALQDGKVGDCIKVQNIDSQVIVMATVNDDGTVEPVL